MTGKSLRKDKITAIPPPLPESGFSFTLARVAVSQICRSMGFNRAQSPALEALTDIATRYLRAIAKVSAASANSNGRTQSNLFDVVYALEDLAGFPASFSIRSRSSVVIKDLIKFVKYTDEIPFAQPLEPRRRYCFSKMSFSKYRDSSRWYNVAGLKHVPRWLPSLPLIEGNEEREREVRWECLGDRERNWECGVVERELNNELEISEKRGKVRFKIGVRRKMIGKLRGVGIGKRVWSCAIRPGPRSDEEYYSFEKLPESAHSFIE